MKLHNWLGTFEKKLRWNFFVSAMQKRRFVRMQRRARRRQDSLSSQAEDLEKRIMLSGTTAVNDQAVLNHVGVPITFDVLSNDISGNGDLDIANASVVGGGGTAIIVQGDASASGAESRDRIEVTVDAGHTGNISVQYTAEDAGGTQSTATLSISVNASLGDTFTSGSGGAALNVASGTGNGHLATPTDRYLPTVSGDYTYTEAIVGASYTAQGASGTQDIARTVTTTSYGVANWSYTELVIWSYDINSNDGAGTTQHLWGSYTYTFSSVSVNGVITTTLAYNSTDSYDNNTVTDDGSTYFANNTWGNTLTTITVINVDDLLDSGSLYYLQTSTANSLGNGSYSRPMPGGSISGTMNSNSLDFNTLTMSKAYTELAIGGFYVSGTVSMNGNGNKSFSYNGGGTYGDSSMMTTASESGGQTEMYTYLGNGNFTNLAGWALAGSGYTSGDHHSNFSHSGTGSYSREFHGGTMAGTQNANGYNNSRGDFRVDYSLGNTGWYVTAGNNSASGESLSHFDFAGSGSYVYTQSASGFSQTLSGSMAEDGHNTSQSDYTTAGTLNASTMEWTYTGSGSGSGNNHEHLHYEGSGSYNRTIHGGSVSGSATELYDHQTAGNFQNQSTLVNNSDWIVTGSGSASGTSLNHTTYSGQGSYSRTAGSAPNQITYSGLQKQDGHEKVQQSWQTTSQLDATGLVTTNGSGSGTTDSHTYSYFSGSGSYSRPTSDGQGTISGTRNEEREDYQENEAKTQTTFFDQEYGSLNGAAGGSSIGTGWSNTTGSASANGHGFANTNWSGSANYSKSWTKSQGNATTSYSGSVELKEKGHAKSNYSASSISNLDASGNWIRTSGSGVSSGNNYDYAFNKTTGSYTKDTTGGNDHQSHYAGSFMNSETAENHGQWSEVSSVIGGQFAQVAGSSSGSGSSETISSNSGHGTYSYNGGAYNAHISGSVNENRYSLDKTAYSTSSTWSASSGWITTGSLSGEGHSDYHSDYSGSGRMNTISSLASSYNSSSGTTRLMGDVNENGHTNTHSKYSSTSTWDNGNQNPASGQTASSAGWKLDSGSASNWGDGLTHVDWDGSGSYASGGSDNRWGNWSVNGQTTVKGHDNTNNKWETTSTVQSPASATEKDWVAVSGSASDWGDSLNEKTHSGSGSWSAWVVDGDWWPLYALIPGSIAAGAYQISGTVSQNGSEKDTDNWNTTSELDLSAGSGGAIAASGGNTWKVINGSLSGTYHQDNRDEFAYSSSSYKLPGATWMTGEMTAYGFDQVVEDANWQSSWSQSVATHTSLGDGYGHVSYGPGWALVSGSGRVDETSGSGKAYSGSGTFSSGGAFSSSAGGGNWNFSASATQSGRVEDNAGVFVTSAVQSGSWVVTDGGVTASGLVEEQWQWSGTGSYTRGAMSGSFGQGAQSYYKDQFSFEWTEAGTLTTADRDENWNTSNHSNYAASGQVDLLGVPGLYQEDADANGSSSGSIDYDWDETYSEGQWIANSGSVTDTANASGGNSFSGSALFSAGSGVTPSSSPSVGGTTLSERSFDNRFNVGTSETYKVVAQTPVDPATITESPEIEWELDTGTHTEGGNGNFDAHDLTTSSINTPIYLIATTSTNEVTTHSDYTWSRTSTYGTNGWSTSGSGTKTGFTDTSYSYSGAESFATTGGSGTRYERKTDNTHFDHTISETWVDTGAGSRPGGNGQVVGADRNGPSSGSAGRWDASGSASGNADGTWAIGENKTEAWSKIVRGTQLTGTQTLDYSEDYAYSSFANYTYDDQGDTNPANDAFRITSGGGSGDGNGNYTLTASASSAYSATFDGGQGTIAGTANASKREHWDSNYHRDLSLGSDASGNPQWELSASGETNFDGFDKWDYAGSGGYDITTPNANGYSRASATMVESAHNNYNYSGGETWENNEWDYGWEKWGDAASDSTYTKYTEYSSTTTYNQNGHNNTDTSQGHTNFKEQWHSENSYTETYDENMTAGVLTWDHTGSGSNSGYHQIDSDSYSHQTWNHSYSSSTMTSFNNGYSTSTTDNYDRWENWGAYTWDRHEDGSSNSTDRSGGSHDWSWGYSNAYSGSWGETHFGSGSGMGSGSGFGGMSMSPVGSGSGGNWSTGGSYGSGWASGDAGYTSWAFSSSSSTPANPPGSGSGGNTGDGIQRWAASDIGIGGDDTLELPDASPPTISMPNLGMAEIPGFTSLGSDEWRDLSNAELFWNAVDFVEDAFAWAGDQVRGIFDIAAGWIEDAGIWASETFGWEGFEIAGSFLAGVTRGVGDIVGGMVDIPAALNSIVDTLSDPANILDGVQAALDVVGFIPVVGEIADGINGVISLARGDYVGAALSFTSMIPLVGDAIGKGGKAARFIANKADDVLAAGRWIKCKVTGKGCFVAGTQVWLSAVAEEDQEAFSPYGFDSASPDALTSNSLLTASRHEGSLVTDTPPVTKHAIESVPIGSRVTGENPQPWDYDDELPQPDQETWRLVSFSLQKDDGTWIDVEMIRPAEYWEAQEAVPDNYVYMEFPELEASGLALVKSAGPCPPIAEGTGNVVTSRIVTRQATELIELELEGGETLAGTPMHPIWSIERQDWVDLEELEVGEHLWTDDGPVEVLSSRLCITSESVYNLEVHGHHIYQVTELGVLVHNAGIKNYKLRGKKHPKTGVKFNKDGYPIFKSKYSTTLPKSLYKASDAKQFRYALKQLQKAIKKNPALKKRFTKKQLADIMKGKKPKGMTWHHHQTPGKMQLVNSKIHNATGHTGGRNIWGGGTGNR